MTKPSNFALVAALAAAVAVVLVAKQWQKSSAATPSPGQPATVTQASSIPVPETGGLPLLLDLGATQCIPCKMMAPILEQMEKDYAGKMTVRFIDVWENEQAGQAYRIRGIPTQLFFDPQGRELFRHSGFYSREEIMDQWKQLGYAFP